MAPVSLALAVAVLAFPCSASADNVDSVQVGIAGTTLPNKPRAPANHHQPHQNAKATTFRHKRQEGSFGHRQATTTHHRTQMNHTVRAVPAGQCVLRDSLARCKGLQDNCVKGLGCLDGNKEVKWPNTMRDCKTQCLNDEKCAGIVVGTSSSSFAMPALTYCNFYSEGKCVTKSYNKPSSGIHWHIYHCKKAPMQCNDNKEGFVAFGGEITGLIKSCPKEKQIREPDKFCSDNQCKVDPDRANCCRERECVCPNGVNSKGDDCATDGERDCKNCSTGYEMSADAGPGEQTCNENTCTCPGGTGTTGANCAKDGNPGCSKCDPGYTFEKGSQTCKANTCTCTRGTASRADGESNSKCITDGDVDCGACDTGYQFDKPFSDTTFTTCSPKSCATDSLPSGTEVDASRCDSTTTEGTCSVTCKAGYTGKTQIYTCGTNGRFSGNAMICTPNPCETKDSLNCFPDNTMSENCNGKKNGDTCKVTCSQGYGSNEATYECKAAGWTCPAVIVCPEDPCSVDLKIENGKEGTCTNTLQGGGTCEIVCDSGYKVNGKMSCTAGKLAKATCVEEPCVGAALPKDSYQDKGTCEDSLASGSSCNPTCATGYTFSSATSCDKGHLTAGVCESDLKCTLTYGKDLGSMDKGYWSEDETNLNYDGCEHFCTQKNALGPEKVTGCELFQVSGSTRIKKGRVCFAHIGTVTLGNKHETAACRV